MRPYPLADLPRLLGAQVEVGRALLRHLPREVGPDFAEVCRTLGGPITITLTEAYAAPVRELAAQARGARVRIGGREGRFGIVVIDPLLAPRLARRALGTDGHAPELAAPRPLTHAEEGALELVVAALLDGTLRTEGPIGEAELGEIGARLSSEAWLLCLQAQVETPVGNGFARLVAPESMRLAMPASSAPGAALFRRREWLEAARVTLAIELGRTAIARADFAALAVHDVLLLARVGVRDARGGPVMLRLGRGAFRARLDGDALTLLEPYRLGLGATDMDQETKASEEGKAALLGELPVELVCEVGRVTLTGRELLELQPGAVLPVGRPLAGPVDLTVGGRVVARGEFVDVEGEIGVRITQLSA